MNFDTFEVGRLRPIALQTLQELVTKEGIYASSSKGHEGVFHGFYGRDTIITAQLIIAAEQASGEQVFTENAVHAVLNLGTWQGRNDNPATGEELGKITHEVRLDPTSYWHLTEGAVQIGNKAWYVDPEDNTLKNWDSVDSTPLWAWSLMGFYESGLLEMSQLPVSKIKLALNWCMRNLQENGGFAGFECRFDREFGGLFTQGWKDSHHAYLSEETGDLLKHPLKDVFASGLVWASLKRGQSFFEPFDPQFSEVLKKAAVQLKARFNSIESGFLFQNSQGGYYFGECFDKNNILHKAICIDPGLCFWSNVNGECIIDEARIPEIVNRIMEKDIFDPEAGVRVYSNLNKHYDPLKYHRGPDTFWPFVSGLLAKGLLDMGYMKEVNQIINAMLKGVDRFGTCTELFLREGDGYTRYKDPHSGNFSCSDQAWTAGAVYYGCALVDQFNDAQNKNAPHIETHFVDEIKAEA